MFAVLIIIAVVVVFWLIPRMGGTTKAVAKTVEAPRVVIEAAPAVVARTVEASTSAGKTVTEVSKVVGSGVKDAATHAAAGVVETSSKAKTAFDSFRNDVRVERTRIRKNRAS